MRHRLIPAALLAITLVLHGTAYVLSQPASATSAQVLYGIALPLYHGLLPLELLFVGTLFLDRTTMLTWLRFFGISIVPAAALILMTSPAAHGFLEPDRTDVTRQVLVALVIVNVLYLLARHVITKRAARLPAEE
jgi:hypothetical protein